MIRRAFALVAVAMMIGTAAGGCGTETKSCEQLCDEQAECGKEGFSADECKSDCGNLDALHEASGCGDEYDKLVECMSGLEDVCVANECGGQGTAYAFCILGYCGENPDACSDTQE